MKDNCFAILDIGTTRVVCLIAFINGQGICEIMGLGQQSSKGIRSGLITDMNMLKNSILASIEEAENKAGERIDRVVVNLNGNRIVSRIVRSSTKLHNKQIANKDLDSLISRVITKYSGSSEEVIHVFPLEYSIDGIKGIKDPVSMYGSELSGDIHVITAPKSMINNIANCLGQCQLDIQGFVSSPYVCGLSCLTDDEMDMGSLLIDMGGGNTSFAVFGNKKLVFAGSLNIGSDYVTSDIALGLSISVEEAERLKVLHGSVMNHSLHSQQVINIPFTKEGDEEPFYITYAMLSIVIRARLEEILQMVCKKTSKIMDYSHYHRIVLTGGGSQIMGIKELAQQVFACAARVAGPKTSDIQFRYEKNDNVDQNPVFSTSFGMLQFAAKDLYTPLLTAGTQHAGGVIRKIIAWVKGN